MFSFVTVGNSNAILIADTLKIFLKILIKCGFNSKNDDEEFPMVTEDVMIPKTQELT